MQPCGNDCLISRLAGFFFDRYVLHFAWASFVVVSWSFVRSLSGFREISNRMDSCFFLLFWLFRVPRANLSVRLGWSKAWPRLVRGLMAQCMVSSVLVPLFSFGVEKVSKIATNDRFSCLVSFRHSRWWRHRISWTFFWLLVVCWLLKHSLCCVNCVSYCSSLSPKKD